MIVELITTGSELLLGQIVNTNAAWMAQKLNEIGFDVCYQTTVGDNRARMEETVRHALTRANIIITSGGLGPTRGDITKEVCADVFGRALSLNEECAERLKENFRRREKEMTENNLRQAMIPEGAKILVNHAGTAPGIVLEEGDKVIINLPGPPHEMKGMFTRSVVPYLAEKFGLDAVIISRVLDTYGIGESQLETKIQDLILAQKNPTLALLCRPTGNIIRITAKAKTRSEAESLIAPVESEIRSRVSDFIYAVDDEPMEEIVGKLLKEKRLTIAAAESCTGGLFTSRLTDVAGASEYVKGSIVSYTLAVKEKALGVKKSTLDEHGAVSEQAAREMAEGARSAMSSDIAVAITGNAGPSPSEGKPIGLVYVAVAGERGTVCEKNILSGKRAQIKFSASQSAMNMVRRYLLGEI